MPSGAKLTKIWTNRIHFLARYGRKYGNTCMTVLLPLQNRYLWNIAQNAGRRFTVKVFEYGTRCIIGNLLVCNCVPGTSGGVYTYTYHLVRSV